MTELATKNNIIGMEEAPFVSYDAWYPRCGCHKCEKIANTPSCEEICNGMPSPDCLSQCKENKSKAQDNQGDGRNDGDGKESGNEECDDMTELRPEGPMGGPVGCSRVRPRQMTVLAIKNNIIGMEDAPFFPLDTGSFLQHDPIPVLLGSGRDK